MIGHLLRLIAVSGLIARDERKRKHAMHAAVVSQTIMALMTLGYIVMAVRSVVQARRPR